MAVAAVVGGGVGIVTAAFGAYFVASGSFPLAFGLDVNGDRPYPYPFPEAVLVGAVFIVVGLVLAASLTCWLRGQSRARLVAIAALGTVIGLAALVASFTGEAHRCAMVAYTGIEYCTSRSTATTRDLVLLSALPLVALLGLAASFRRAPLEG
jgi:hypothetical protein